MPAALRPARPDDAPALHRLVRDSGVLEVNSGYAYALLSDHFRDTCVVAERGGEVVGFVAAYRPPRQPDAVFVWQIGVAEDARGEGLGRRLLLALLEVPGCAGVRALLATVTPGNEPSRRLFRSLARTLAVGCEVRPGIPADRLGEGHEAEDLFVVGPLPAPSPHPPEAP